MAFFLYIISLSQVVFNLLIQVAYAVTSSPIWWVGEGVVWEGGGVAEDSRFVQSFPPRTIGTVSHHTCNFKEYFNR
jgi:hypothetical protein